MFRALSLGVLMIGIFSSCTSARNLSNVGLRELSSVHGGETVSKRRLEISQQKEFGKSCPLEVREEFGLLALDIIQFPACPEALTLNFASAAHYFQNEERTVLEEAISSQCRSFGSVTDGTALDQVLTDTELANLSSRATGGNDPALEHLKAGIQELSERHLLLDRWTRQNGDFTLSEEVLLHLDELINEHKCKLFDDEVDQSYRSIRALEDLARVLPEGRQRGHIQRFLQGIYDIQDRKIEEFFRK